MKKHDKQMKTAETHTYKTINLTTKNMTYAKALVKQTIT